MEYNKYNNGLIYKILSLSNPTICYIGSTCLTLKLRLALHKSKFKNYKKTGKNYYSSFKVLENQDFSIELIETFPCNSRNELTKREGFYIQQIECVNKQMAGRTKQESNQNYYENNKQVICENKKKYRQEHELSLKQKKSCECGGKFTTCTKSIHFKSKKHQNFLTTQL